MDAVIGERIAKYLKYGKESEVDSIIRAYELAFDAHKEQKRKSGEPYIMHPLAVTDIVIDMAMDADSIKAALMHDTVEDTGMTVDDVERELGSQVAELVDGLTKLENIHYSSKEEEEMENLRKMFLAMAKDIRVIVIKLADRLHNVRTIEGMRESKRREYALETMEIYAPIAHRLGITKIENELENKCLLYLDPIGYNEIIEGLDSRRVNDDFLEKIKKRIISVLDEQKIPCKVDSREKNIYSIYRKLFSQNRTFDDIYDIYALRIIVDTKNDCYNVLGLIHDMYNPVPGRFKDYISTPKPNMYQSLHTTLISHEGITFEVQIRTWDMHYIAEYGIAAHWKYKHGLKAEQTESDEKLAWVRRLMETQQDTDAEDFIRSMKIDLFDDDVYVFTPKGDVINLPAGANTIDLAYAIHSAIGNRMIGAKVNGRMVPIDYQLKNGEVVEILTTNSSKGPSRDWINIVKTSEARNKIRQWYKKEKKEENILLGKEMIHQELKKQKISLTILNQTEAVLSAAKKLSYRTVEDLYAGVGYGGITAQRTVNRIKEEAKEPEKTAENGEEAIVEKAISKSKTPPSSGIEVEGIESCLVKFAKCCTPVPGDEIIGFVTRGYGVSVHRADCKNVKKTRRNEEESGERLVKVTWNTHLNSTFPSLVKVSAVDRFGLLADIANIIANMKITISMMNAKEVQEGVVELFITVNVTDKTQLDMVCTRINSVRGVVEVKRSAS